MHAASHNTCVVELVAGNRTAVPTACAGKVDQPKLPVDVVWSWRLKGCFAPASAVMGRQNRALGGVSNLEKFNGILKNS